MNRILLGTILGVTLGITDVLLTLRHGAPSATALLQAFSSSFALGFLGANVVLPWASSYYWRSSGYPNQLTGRLRNASLRRNYRLGDRLRRHCWIGGESVGAVA